MKYRFRKLKGAARIAAAAAGFAAGAAFDAELLIYGDIGECWYAPETTTSARDVVQQLQDAGRISTLLARVNSYGGSVTDGTAIYNALRATKAKITVRIDGVAASMAGLIAMAGDTVEMGANTLLMIHAPWSMAVGNSKEMREMADVLDTFANAMSTSYARKSGRTAAEELVNLTDGTDHWYTAAEAKAAGYCDAIVDDADESAADAAARYQPVIGAVERYRSAPTAIAASVRPHMLAAMAGKQPQPTPAPAGTPPRSQKMFLVLATALRLKIAADQRNEASAKALVLAHLKLSADATDEEVNGAVAAAVAAANGPIAITAPAPAVEMTRDQEITAMFEVGMRGPRATSQPLADLRDRLLVDTAVSAADARKQLIAAMTNDASSIGGSSAVRAGQDESEKRVSAKTAALLARMGKATPEQKAALGQNPYRGMRLIDMAEETLAEMGIKVRGSGLNRHDIAEYALGRRDHRVSAAQTTSDFPVVLENTLHKIVLDSYMAAASTWSQFCGVMDVSDYRDWGMLVPGALGNLEDVTEAGEYKNKNIPDAGKNVIRATRKGNIIEITPEVLVNDDAGWIMKIAQTIGLAGARTIEARVYQVLNSNPVMSDGFALFSAQHGNYVAQGSGGAPSQATINAGVIAMGMQKLPSDPDDFADITPNVAVTSLANVGPLRQIIQSPFDPDATSKLQRPNIVYNAVENIVSSARVAVPTQWYFFANIHMSPVLMVAFLDGQREPTLKQDESFRTGGLRWRAELPFGIGVADYRGAYSNYGA